MQLQLPNGQFIEVPDDISEEQKQKILSNINNSSKFQKKYQVSLIML